MKIATFGEAEHGEFYTPMEIGSVPELFEMVGHPPEESQGILYAIEALLYGRELYFVRVKEEGFSVKDYLRGFKRLQDISIDAICLPGVGDATIIEATKSLCSVLVTSERDFFDYVTALK